MRFVNLLVVCFVFALLALVGCGETQKPQEVQPVAMTYSPALTPPPQLSLKPDIPLFDDEAIDALKQIDDTGYMQRTVVSECSQNGGDPGDSIWTTSIHGQYIFVVAGYFTLSNNRRYTSWNGRLFRFRQSDLKTDSLSLGEFKREGPAAFSATAIDGKFVFVFDGGTIVAVDPNRLLVTNSASLRPEIEAGDAVLDSIVFAPNRVSIRGGVQTDDSDHVATLAYPLGATWSASMNLKTWKTTDRGVFKRTI